jgi:hypothetical protein
MSNATKSSQVPGQFLGYSLQTTECLKQLLCATPKTIVSVEAFEDVGTQEPDGTDKFVQTKSATEGNPVADRSLEWWKAISAWIGVAKKDGLKQNRIFNLHVFSPKNAPLATVFSNANTPEAAADALQHARQMLWGAGPDFPLKKTLADSIRAHVNALLDSDTLIARYVIEKFTLTFGSNSSREDLRLLPAAKFIPEEYLNDVLDKCLGWVKGKIEACIEEGKPAEVNVDIFTKEMNAFIKKLSFVKILNDFAGSPTVDDIAQHEIKTFVSQLRIIDADEEEILRAINSYLRAATNRSEWGERFLVHADSFVDYMRALQTFWTNTKKQQDLDYSADPCEKRGLRLLLGCTSHRQKLEGQDVPDDFTPGCFHELADDETVGWHPSYKAKLKEKEKNGKSGS